MLTPLAMAVLELLHERPAHPYEMVQTMRERYVDQRVKLKPGSLYHTVERLLRDELIEVVDTRRDGRRPERTVYGLTDAGRDAFTRRGRELVGDVVAEYPSFPSGLAVLFELGADAALVELERRITALESAVAGHEVLVRRLIGAGTQPIHWLDLRFAVDRMTFELDWTRRLVADLRSGRIPFRAEPCSPDDRGRP